MDPVISLVIADHSKPDLEIFAIKLNQR
jgi:hypothetical protein